MRFASTAAVVEWADRTAAVDWQIYCAFRSDFNPYCTPGAIRSWERGFIGDPPLSYEGDLRWDYKYQRGAAAARIIQTILSP